MRSVLIENKQQNVSEEHEETYEGGTYQKREINISSNTQKTGDTEICEQQNRIQTQISQQYEPDWDSLMEEQGGLGLFQIVAFMIITLQTNSFSWVVYNISYFTLQPDYLCTYPDGSQYGPDDNDPSRYKLNCNQTLYCDSSKGIIATRINDNKYTLDNWILKFDLQCPDSYKIPTFFSIYIVGFTLGSLTIAYFMDKFGRKRVFIFSMIIIALVHLQFLLFKGPYDKDQNTVLFYFYFLFFIGGLFSGGRVNTGYSLMLEMLPNKSHNIMGTIWIISEGIVFLISTLILEYITKNTDVCIWIGLIMNVTGTFFQFFLPESPKLLLSQKKYNELYQVLQMMAKVNKSESYAPQREQLLLLANYKVLDQDDSRLGTETLVQEESPLKQLLSGSNLLNLIGLISVWLSASFCYYTISFQLKYIEGDKYTNGIVSALSECVAYCLSGIIFRVIGLKGTLIISYVVAISGMLGLILFQPKSQSGLSICIIGAKFGISQIFNIAYICNAYLFPIQLVATSLSLSTFTARFITIFVPYIGEIKPESIPQWIFVGIAGLAFVLSLLFRPPQKQIDK